MTVSSTETMQPVLSAAEVEQFAELGYVIIKGALTRDEAARYRDLILDMVPRTLVIPENWSANAGRLKPHHEPEATRTLSFDDNQAFLTPELLPLLCHERLYGAAVQLLGSSRLRVWDGSLGITLRNDSGPVLSQPVHVDPGVPSALPNFLFTAEEVGVGGCYYLTDVEPSGGGLHIVPGGHKMVEKEAKAHPQGAQLHARWRRVENFPETVEVTGEAGDFVMTHYLMPHAASNNRRPAPRVAQFTRFTHENHPHYPGQPSPPGCFNDSQLRSMSSVGRQLFGVDPW
jgi:ectoine hydroxylase-related dioxygenase (phytanoyl-CoA dioxygenase family)